MSCRVRNSLRLCQRDKVAIEILYTYPKYQVPKNESYIHLPMADQPSKLFEDKNNTNEAKEQKKSSDSQNQSTTDFSKHAHKEPEELLVWDAPNRVFDPKSAQWFLGLFAAGLVAIIVFAIFREILLILVVAAFIFVYYALARVEPLDIEHRVLTIGIEVGGRLYSWEDLKSFWIEQETRPALLKVETKLLMPHSLELLLPEDTPAEDLQELTQLLSQYLPVEEKPHSQTGAMADHALLSLSNFVPKREKFQHWIEEKLIK